MVKNQVNLQSLPSSETIEELKKIVNEGDIWLGQERRKRAMKTIVRLAEELLPLTLKRFACEVSYRTGLSLRKVMDDYLEVLIEVGILKTDGNMLTYKDG